MKSKTKDNLSHSQNAVTLCLRTTKLHQKTLHISLQLVLTTKLPSIMLLIQSNQC